MSGIFISYRRADSPDATGRIYDCLVAEFGKAQVFKDIDSIPLGRDFRGHLGEMVGNCDAVLTIIGPHWADAHDEAGKRRLEDPDDFVRIELEAALARSIPVVPVLVGHALMPTAAQLPASLTQLAFRQSIEVRPDPDFHNDATRLVMALRRIIDPSAPEAEPAAAAGIRAGGAVRLERTWRRRAMWAVSIAAIAAAGMLAAWTLRPGPPQPGIYRFSDESPSNFRGTVLPAIALSPDGRRVVYNTASGLLLRSFDELGTRPIPGTEALLVGPFFSPDGQSIGFFQNGQLKRISVNGGAAVTICAVEGVFSGASWLPDDTILFAHTKGIQRVSASGGVAEWVVPAGKGERLFGPQLLPDGESVLFTVVIGAGFASWDQATIAVHSLRTGQRSVVLRGGSDARYLATGHLLYAVGNSLLAVNFDAQSLRVGGGPVPVLEGIVRPVSGANTVAANYAVADTGMLVYLQLGTMQGAQTFGGIRGQAANLGFTLAWVDRAGREEPIAAPARRYTYARLSPDGTRIVLDSRDQDQDLWVWDLRRQSMTRFTFDPDLDVNPLWSPDGRWIVWSSTRAASAGNLHWQPSDGTGAVEALSDGDYIGNLQRASGFTPDGRLLLFFGADRAGGSSDLKRLALEGDRAVTSLMVTPFNERNGELSPDGRWLTYESDESGRFEIYVRPWPSVDQGRWQISTAGGRQPAWSHNSRELFFLNPDATLMRVPVASGERGASFSAGTPEKLLDGAGYLNTEGTPNQGRTYDISLDDRRFLRIKTPAAQDAAGAAGRDQLIIVQNWFEELRRLAPAR